MAVQTASLISDIRSQFDSFFQGLNLSKKVFLFVALATIIIGMVILILNSQTKTFTSLYHGISPEEASRITQKLDELQIEYIIEAGGSRIMVPSSLKDRAMISLAGSSDLNIGKDAGYNILSDLDYRTTEATLNLQHRRALEGEISNLLRKISYIQDAKVLLALEKQALFLDQESKTTAAVTIGIRGINRLSQRQVDTIINLVAGAVPRLETENISLADQSGNYYKEIGEDLEASDIQSKHLLIKRKIELNYQEKIARQLGKIVGKENIEVSVVATLNFHDSQIEENLVDPDGTAIVSLETINEKATGSRSIPVGIPGATSNSPEVRAGASEVANVSDSDKKIKRQNNEISKTKILRRDAVAKLQKLDVSVLVDWYEDPETEIKKDWDQKDLEKFEALAKHAVGFTNNENRKDTFVLKSIQFKITEEEKIRKEEIDTRQLEIYLEWIKVFIIPVMVIILIFTVIKPMITKLSAKPEDLDLLMGLPTTIGELEGEELEIPTEKDVGIPSRDKIMELAKEDPLRTASMLRTWLREKKS